MKKIVCSAVSILLTVAIIGLGLCYFSEILTAKELNDYPARNQFFQTVAAEDSDTLDVLFVGDSTVLNGVSPVNLWEQTGITSYNISYSLMKTREAYFDTKKVLETQSPKVIMLEAAFLVDESKKNNPLQDSLAFANNQFVGAIDSFAPVMKYKSEWEKLTVKDFFTKRPNTINSIYKGYNYSSDSQAHKDGEVFVSEGDVNYKDNADRYFKLIYDLCKGNDCKLVLFSLPHISAWNQQRHDKVQELADKYSVQYIDWHLVSNEIISWETDTQDGGAHLNYSGATKTTKVIGDYLVNELGLKPTELTKEQTEKWNADAKEFHKTIGE